MALNDLSLVDRATVTSLSEAALVVIIALVLAWLGHSIIFRLLRHLSKASASETDDRVIRRLVGPTRYAMLALAVVLAAREITMLERMWVKAAGIVMPALIGWVVLAILQALVETMSIRADVSVADNLDARRTRTKLTMFNRLATFVIVFVTVGLMLLSIPGVRDIGLTLVASAGLAAVPLSCHKEL